MAVLEATYWTYLCVQYWSAVVYNAEVAVKFSELPSIQNYPELPYYNSSKMRSETLVNKTHSSKHNRVLRSLI